MVVTNKKELGKDYVAHMNSDSLICKVALHRSYQVPWKFHGNSVFLLSNPLVLQVSTKISVMHL